MRNKQRRFIYILLIAALALIVPPPVSAEAAAGVPWDGKTIDVSWYNKTDTAFEISTPAQLMGLAAIVNGIYNVDVANVIGDKGVIIDNTAGGQGDGGGNNKSTDTYHYGADSFKGKTVRLTADLDMGGKYDPSTGLWSGPDYMPVGGQYLMTQNDPATKLSSSFCGTFDGQGHTVYNIYCSRRCTTGNFGDGQSVGLIGRLGVHDGDAAELRPTDPTVKNVAVTGYLYANRSVGGIVGKIGKTTRNNGDDSTGGVIENCANFATVSNTDSKGCGGIVGAGWNGGLVKNCYNAGRIMSTYACPTGGISGSNEITLENCYNVGTISAARESYAMGIGTNNGGAPYEIVHNCWYLDGSAPGGGYFSGGEAENSGALASDKMKSDGFVNTLGTGFTADTNGVNGGYPILAWQKGVAVPYFSSYSDVPVTSWYFSTVNAAMSKGLFDTIGTGKFGPEQPMTRAMLATALYRLAGSPDASEATASDGAGSGGVFTDIPNSAAYGDAVTWAYEAGVVNGATATTFDPEGTITREQIAAMMYRYAQWAKDDTTALGSLSGFTDAASISSWAKDAMSWAVGQKLMDGMGNGTIAPRGTTTRAQTAAILMRFAEE